MTSYSPLQNKLLAKFVHTTCIFRDAGKRSRRHRGCCGLSPSK